MNGAIFCNQIAVCCCVSLLNENFVVKRSKYSLTNAMSAHKAQFVVVGGGIAAVSCVEQLCAECASTSAILLISACPIVKVAANWQAVGRTAEQFDVQEQEARSHFEQHDNVTVLQAAVTSWSPMEKTLHLSNGSTVLFEYLCIATGGRPKQQFTSDRVITIRDTETVVELQRKLKNARRVLLVGNGGIATEFVYEVCNIEIVWAIKHSSINATFFDAGAAEFFLAHLKAKSDVQQHQSSNMSETATTKSTDAKCDANEMIVVSKRLKYTTTDTGRRHGGGGGVAGSALGPDWANRVDMRGALNDQATNTRKLHITSRCEVAHIHDAATAKAKNLTKTVLPTNFINNESADWPMYVELTNGEVYGCDWIVSAVGVQPNAELWACDQLKLAEDGGIVVNDQFECSVPNVFAVGDVCTVGWTPAPHWLQMRLWTQARQMGTCAGHVMTERVLHPECNGRVPLDICFEIFTHVTEFFGFKTILLGKYNAQGLGEDHEVLLRVTPGEEYIKVLVQDGCVQGAILIGETDLEETLENLILNGTDIEHLKDGLLNPTVDLEDYFD